jgi:hypothetical protein
MKQFRITIENIKNENMITEFVVKAKDYTDAENKACIEYKLSKNFTKKFTMFIKKIENKKNGNRIAKKIGAI